MTRQRAHAAHEFTEHPSRDSVWRHHYVCRICGFCIPPQLLVHALAAGAIDARSEVAPAVLLVSRPVS